MLNSKILYFDELDSTNIKMKQLAESGAESGLIIRAGYQTRGKGRLGRRWESARGDNLYMSILLGADKKIRSPSNISLISLITGLGVRTAVEYYIKKRIMIKWPNDVVLGNRKISGILVEAVHGADGIRYFIIGIGVNINSTSFPTELADKATSFYMETGIFYDLDAVAYRTVTELDRLYTLYIDSASYSSFLDEYSAYCVNIGAAVKLIHNGIETEGTALGLNPEGELLVETVSGKIITARSGEVSLRGVGGYV